MIRVQLQTSVHSLPTLPLNVRTSCHTSLRWLLTCKYPARGKHLDHSHPICTLLTLSWRQHHRQNEQKQPRQQRQWRWRRRRRRRTGRRRRISAPTAGRRKKPNRARRCLHPPSDTAVSIASLQSPASREVCRYATTIGEISSGKTLRCKG